MENDWRDKAECAKAEDPEIFFPSNERAPEYRRIVFDAKQFCLRCLVQEQCLDYAIENNELAGIWGGLTKDELKAERRKRARRY